MISFRLIESLLRAFVLNAFFSFFITTQIITVDAFLLNRKMLLIIEILFDNHRVMLTNAIPKIEIHAFVDIIQELHFRVAHFMLSMHVQIVIVFSNPCVQYWMLRIIGVSLNLLDRGSCN